MSRPLSDRLPDFRGFENLGSLLSFVPGNGEPDQPDLGGF